RIGLAIFGRRVMMSTHSATSSLKSAQAQHNRLLASLYKSALRGGIFFIQYLNPGCYCGLDINESLIEAGKLEVASANLEHKQPLLIVDDQFNASKAGIQFDFAIAQSVFTHLFTNHITRCLIETKKVLKPNGKLYATFFEAPHAAHLQSIQHQPGNVSTHFDKDPFHQSFDEMQHLGQLAGFQVELVGDWGHPRAQRMLCFKNGD
ncbi:class I SAM-dependent methyltransferase, partial [Leptolyngbya sp. AN02str]|uniref:class I SAM-dependent methyltransferase n=1 Tax=Leptolyngbya sp. AN02str TaxID=3423363 RepID=UPI003D31ABA0